MGPRSPSIGARSSKGQYSGGTEQLVDRFAALGYVLPPPSGHLGASSNLSSSRLGKSGMKRDEPTPGGRSTYDLNAKLNRMRIQPEQDVFNLSAVEEALAQQALEEAKIKANLEKVSKPKIAAPPRLTAEMKQTVTQALKNPRFVSKVAREQVEAKDLRLLGPGQWLNDEVINFYMSLLQERSNRETIKVDGVEKKKREIHCFNSFFYTKLGDDYAKSRVGRWTKKVSLCPRLLSSIH